jgi:hypothetical protein
MGRWKYKLEDEGKQLRKLIDEGNESLDTIVSVYNQMVVCLKCLKLKLIGVDKINMQYNIDCMIEDFQTSCPEVDTDIYNYYDEENNLNFNLREFYDFCDDDRVWIGL